jgi:hypothetical protein
LKRRELTALFSIHQKWIHHHHTIVVLTVIEVFAEEMLAARGFGSGENSGVPLRDLEAHLQPECRLEDSDGVVLNAEALPLLDEASRYLVWQGIGTTRVSGLDIKLLEHLHGEGNVGPSEDYLGDGGFRRLRRLQIERVDEDVGINEAHDGRGVRSGRGCAEV